MSHFMISWLIQNRCNRISESWKPGDETGGNIAELLSWKDVFRHLVFGGGSSVIPGHCCPASLNSDNSGVSFWVQGYNRNSLVQEQTAAGIY